MIEVGDIFSTKGVGLIGWLNTNLTVTPSGHHTERFHFGVIADKVFDKDGKFIDFETRESLWKGPSCDRFFKRYLGSDIELYRIPDLTEEEKIRSVRASSEIGDKPYGYQDFLFLLLDMIANISKGKPPPYTSQQLKYSKDNDYICTELAAYGAREIGKPIEPPDDLDIWDIPSVYLQANRRVSITLKAEGNVGTNKEESEKPPSINVPDSRDSWGTSSVLLRYLSRPGGYIKRPGSILGLGDVLYAGQHDNPNAVSRE